MGYDAPSTDLNDPQVQQQQQQQVAPNTAAGAAVAPILQGIPDLANTVAKAFLVHTTQIAQNSTVAQKTQAIEQQKKQAAATPVQDRDQDQPAPGSFGSKLLNAAGGIAGALGDAAHASDTKGGWLSGVANTLNARNKRLAEEQKDQILLAKTQAETVAMHRNVYLQDSAIRAASYKGNQDFVDTFRANHDIEEGVTHGDLKKRTQSDKDFAKNYYVRATSEEPVLDSEGRPKTDKFGNPATVPLYTIVTKATKDGAKDDKTLTADMSADIRKYLGISMPPNTKLTSSQFASLNGAMNMARNATNILNTTNEKDLTDEQIKVLSPYLTDTTIQAAISHVPGSAYAGLQQYQNNADLHIQDLLAQKTYRNPNETPQQTQARLDGINKQIEEITAERNKVAAFESQAINPKQIERYKKDAEEGIKWVDKVLQDPSALSGDKASAIIPQLQTALKSETDPGRRAKLTSALDTARVARDNYFEDMSRKAKAEQAAKEGNPVTAGKMLAAGDVTLADLRTKGTTTEFIENAITEAKKIDSTYNTADEVNFEHIAKSPQTAAFFGSARSLLSKGGTLDQLEQWGNKIPDNSLPVLNKLEDWEKLAAGEGPLAGYASLVLGLADDYGKVMGGGSASDSARDAALHLFAAAQTKQQRIAAIEGTAGAVGSQYDSRIGENRFLAREYGGFARTSHAPASENANVTKAQGATKTATPTPTHTADVQRPKDLPTATATGQFKNNKTGQIQTYWTDSQGKPLRAVAPGELPKE